MELDKAVDYYLTHCLSKSEKTQRWYRERLVRFLDWCESDQGVDTRGRIRQPIYAIEDIRPSDVSRFIEKVRTTPNQRSSQPVSSYTVRGYAQVVKGFLNWAEREKMHSSGGKGVDMPKVDEKIIKIFTVEQIKQLFAACNMESYASLRYRDRAILALLLGTGIRASELTGLTLDDIYIKSKQQPYIRVMGKGRKEREIGLPASAIEHLARYINRFRQAPEHERHVFVGHKGVPITPDGLDQMLYRLRDYAGITGVRCSAHTFRHTFAVNFLLQKRGDIYMLSRILGHENISTTTIYLRAMQMIEVRQSSFSVLDLL